MDRVCGGICVSDLLLSSREQINMVSLCDVEAV